MNGELIDKEKFFNYLHEKVGQCSFCKRKDCAHKNTYLPDKIKTTDVISAINYAIYSSSEEETN